MEPIDIRAALATTPVQISSTGLVVNGHTPPPFLLGYLDSVLRGVGQVMMQNNSYAGLLFLIGVFYNSTLFGLAVLVGTSVSTATAMLLAVDRSLVRAGLFGFNGALVSIALLYFLQPDTLTWGYVVLASACTTVLMAAMFNLLGTWKTPALTAPFIFTALCFLLACARFGRLHSTHVLPTAGLPKAATVEGVVTASTVVEGLFSGVAQVFFQGNAITGGPLRSRTSHQLAGGVCRGSPWFIDWPRRRVGPGRCRACNSLRSLRVQLCPYGDRAWRRFFRVGCGFGSLRDTRRGHDGGRVRGGVGGTGASWDACADVSFRVRRVALCARQPPLSSAPDCGRSVMTRVGRTEWVHGTLRSTWRWATTRCSWQVQEGRNWTSATAIQ